METSQRQKTFDARDYLRVVQKRKWFILIVAATAMFIGGIYAFSYPKRYRAMAWVIVYTQPQGFFWIPGEQREQTPQLSLATQAAMAGSNDVAVKAAERLSARSTGRIVVSPLDIASHVNAHAVPPDRICIEVVHENEQYAVGFANATAESFVDLSADYRRKEDSDAVQFLEKQLAKADNDLRRVLQSKQDKQKQWGLVSSESGTVAAHAFHNYESNLEQDEVELAATNAQIASLKQELVGLENSPIHRETVANPYRISLEQQLQTAMLTLAQLRVRYTPNHPAIKQAELQITELREEIEKEPVAIAQDQVIGHVHLNQAAEQLQSTRIQAASTQARIGTLQNLISRTRSKTIDLREKEDLLARDSYEVTLHQKTYEALLQELRDRKLKEAAKRGTADVLDRALRGSPMEVNVWRSVLFTAMLGLVAGIALALVMEVMDTALHTPDDILHATEVDFLGAIPLSENGQQQPVTLTAPRSPPAEAYRTLRANINFALVDNPAQTFLATSAGSGEGKSSVISNLGIVFAQAGQSVILVDSDLRRPVLHRLFKLENAPGLTSILLGELSIEEALQDTEVENLRVITSGPLPPNPTELLDSEPMARFISDIANYADVVLFDSPPAIMLADAIILSAKIDRTILIAESGQVSRDAFNEMVRLISRARGQILGAVLNKMDLSRSGYYYYYYYYYYYGYGHKTPEEEKVANDNQMPVESPIRPLKPEQSEHFNGANSNQDDQSESP